MQKNYLAITLLILSAGLLADSTPKIQLLPHQLYPIQYLQKHEEQKGLLINHYMGTGKTFLAIGAGEAFSKYKVIIIAPRFLEGHWHQQLLNYGVKDMSRYKFVSYHDAPRELLKRDLRSSIVIMDECHNLVQLLRSVNPQQAKAYSDLYAHLQTSHKIVGLSGTLIYGEIRDIAYLINLVSGSELLPYNAEQFRLQYTNVNGWRSFFRGYMSESMILQMGLPMYANIFATFAGNFNFIYAIPASIAGALALPIVNNAFPVNAFTFRNFDAEKLSTVAQSYISFYDIGELSTSEFPSKTLHVREVNFSDQQFEFFLDFAQNSLDTPNLQRIVDDEDVEYAGLNSTEIQKRMQAIPGAGRQIGNLGFSEAPPKFDEIFKIMTQAEFPQTVIYSNYLKNGGLAFAEYLKTRGIQEGVEVLMSTAIPSEQNRIVENFNTGKTKVLILHPEITEGISLKGARQMHVLEPVLSNTALNQIIGRTVRYRSHADLPESERHVDIYLWKTVIPSFSIWTYSAKQKDWWRRYSELSNWSQWGGGIRQVDPFYDRKFYSPDSLAYMNIQALDHAVESLKQVLATNSIETHGR